MPTPPLSSHDFRKAMGHFATGVTIVTAEREPGKIQGMTANSFTSVSLSPMLILVCVDHRAKLLPLIEKKKRFGVSVLKAEQVALSEYFARGKHSTEAEARLGIHFSEIADQTFVIEDTLVQLGCKLVGQHTAGDHTIFVGEVDAAQFNEGEPLLYFRGAYRKIAPAT